MTPGSRSNRILRALGGLRLGGFFTLPSLPAYAIPAVGIKLACIGMRRAKL